VLAHPLTPALSVDEFYGSTNSLYQQGCQIYTGTRYPTGKYIPNNHKIYQMATKYTKWPQNIPNGHKIYQMATKYTKWPQNIPNGLKMDQMVIKYTDISHCKNCKNGILGLRICHLAAQRPILNFTHFLNFTPGGKL
jgi:hypothetical protein